MKKAAVQSYQPSPREASPTSAQLSLSKGRFLDPTTLSPPRLASKYKNDPHAAFRSPAVRSSNTKGRGAPEPDPMANVVMNSPRSRELNRLQKTNAALYANRGSPAEAAGNSKELSNLNKIREILAKNRGYPKLADVREGRAKIAWEDNSDYTRGRMNLRLSSDHRADVQNLSGGNFRGRGGETRKLAGAKHDRNPSLDSLVTPQAQAQKRGTPFGRDKLEHQPGFMTKISLSRDARPWGEDLKGMIRGRNPIKQSKTHKEETKKESRPPVKKKLGALAALLNPKKLQGVGLPSSRRKASLPEPSPGSTNVKPVETGLTDIVSCYVVKTRPGSIPMVPQKTNQDNYVAIRHLANLKNMWFFGVFDGHGVNGHFASDHTKHYLPTNLELIDLSKTGRMKEWASTSGPNAEASSFLSSNIALRNSVIKEAFRKTNKDINSRSFETSFSGTTAVTVFLCGDKLICANVGDSRALLASYKSPSNLASLKLPEEVEAQLKKTDKIWLAMPVSRDHKPDDVDEHKRIIAANGRVEPFKEPNGDPIGPYRVWVQDENVPGLAMSRSIGDRIASTVGVICEPEIFEMKLAQDEKFMIIASDGIWEFITNDKAVEMVVPYWINNDPEGACDKLISESLERWKTEDEVVDDITVIVIFLSIP